MSAIDIPEHVIGVAWRTFVTTHAETGELSSALADALTNAAPLLVSAALRELAGELHRRAKSGQWPRSEGALALCVACLMARAEQLDPEGGQS